MNLPALLLILHAMLMPVQPYETAAFSQAIVDNGLGVPLTWYTPTVTVMSLSGAPAGWMGAASCTRGAIAINPLYADDPNITMTIMHELVHLHNGCNGSEAWTTLAAYETMASLGRDADIIADLYQRVSVLVEGGGDMSPDKLNAYYRVPINTMLYYDLGNYDDLQVALERIGLRERVYGDKQ